jgi:hypothetical protein
MSERKQTIQHVLAWENSTTITLKEFMQIVYDGVPVAHRHAATVEFERNGDYSELSVYFTRDETDAEMAKRSEVSARVDRELHDRREYYDRQEYARLKVKYEGQS